MEFKHFTLDGASDGVQLALMALEPDMEPKGVVQMVHGMCEHKERYEDLMSFLAINGYVCVINDLRGHGASVKGPEDLGYAGKGGFSASIDDEKIVTDWIRKSWPDLPLTLFGHSMGSMIVRGYAKRYDSSIDRLIVCGSPSDNPASGAGKALAWCFGTFTGWHSRPAILQKMAFGTYNKPFSDEPYNRAWVCSNPEILEKYHKDPLCSYTFTANGFYNLMGLMQYCYSRKGWKMANPSLPVMFISGALDPCRTDDAKFASAVENMRRVGYTDVSSKLYEGMRHEIHNEVRRDIVWSDILSFIDK